MRDGALRYRLATPADEPALVDLWSRHSGWGEIDAGTWSHLLTPPYGRATIAVAEDTRTGTLGGQFAFLPMQVRLAGRDVLAYRVFAPIIAPAWRGLRVTRVAHPLAEMYRHAVEAVHGNGGCFVYALPDPRWRRMLRLVRGLDTGTFPLWSVALPLDRPVALPPGYGAEPAEDLGDDVDELWRRFSRLQRCAVVRDARMLRWRTADPRYVVTAVRRGRDLVGLVASREKPDGVWGICDLLVGEAGEAMRATIAAALLEGHERARSRQEHPPLRKAAILVTPMLAPHVEALGFRRDAYDFTLMVHVLDPRLARGDLTSSHWYVSAND